MEEPRLVRLEENTTPIVCHGVQTPEPRAMAQRLGLEHPPVAQASKVGSSLRIGNIGARMTSSTRHKPTRDEGFDRESGTRS